MTRTRHRIFYATSSFLGFVSVSALSPAAAQPVETNSAAPSSKAVRPGQDAAPGDIIVTANKVGQNLQKVSASVAVVSGDLIARQGISQLGDALRGVSGVRVTDAGTGPEVNIRGIGPSYPTRFGGDSGTSTLFDGIYDANVFTGPGYFDVARIEVLRGPQGTLYGRNAEGGVLNVITKNPTQQFGGEAGLTVGNYNLIKATAALNLPISPTLAIRIAGATVKRSGYIKNGTNDNVGSGIRFRALWKPSDGTSILGSIEFSSTGGSGQGAVDPFVTAPSADVAYLPKQQAVTVAGVTHVFRLPGGNFFKQDSVRAFLQITQDVGFGELTVLPSYQKLFGAKARLFSGLANSALDGTGGIDQSALEVRLASKPESRIKWITGLYGYQIQDNPNNTLQTGLDFNTGQIVVLPIAYAMPNDFNHKYSRSFGEFAQVTVPVSDSLRLIGGIRGSQDLKKRVNYATQLLNNGQGVLTRGSFTAINFKASAEYDVTPHSMIYATVSTGYRPGGIRGSANFNPPTSVAGSLTATVARDTQGFYIYPANYPNPVFQVFRPEKLTSIEVGTKNSFLDRRLTVNASLFYYHYQDYQIPNLTATIVTLPNGNTVSVTSLEILSAKKIINWGGELEASFRPTNHDNLTFNAAYLNSDIKTSTIVNGFDLKGSPIENAPKLTLSGGYSHSFPVAGGLLTPSVDLRYSSGYFVGVPGGYGGVATVSSLPPRNATQAQDYNYQRPWFKQDATLTYAPDHGGLSVTAWIRNISNRVVKTGWVQGNQFLAEPRTFGGTVNYRF